MSSPGRSSGTAAKAAPAPAGRDRAPPAAAAKALSVQTAGNQQVLNAFGMRSSLGVPVGAPGDALEREADEVAARITQNFSAPEIHRAGRAVQRQCTSCGGAMPGGGPVSSAPRLPGAGQPLPSGARAYFEPRFGRDFSGVRVHSYPAAAEGSRQIGARAFTLGSDIAFGAGELAPDSASGRRLLAHELTHVVQQEGGAPLVQADGKLTEADLELIRQWIDSTSSSAALPGASSQIPFPKAATLNEWSFKFGQAGLPDPLNQYGGPQEEAGYSDVCPNCHKRPWELRAERRQRDAQIAQEKRKRAEEERQRQREAAWPGMHQAQHEGELAEQATTLSDDIENSKMAVTQLRLQLFDRALGGKTGAGKRPTSSQLTEEMRDGWAAAEQATIVLESLFAATADELSAEVADRVRGPYRAFYASLHQLFFKRDFEQKRIEKFEQKIARERKDCPTRSCHQPAPSRPDFSGFTELKPAQQLGTLSGPSLGGAGFGPQRTKLTDAQELDLLAMLDADQGPRSTHLGAAENRNETAVTRAAWKGVIKDFRWAVTILDEQLRSELASDPEAREGLEQFQYAQELLERQQTFLENHPDALKVRAIFYPKYELTEKTDDKGAKSEIAKGLPWQFYMTRTPWSDPRTVPGDYEWQLHDITAPVRPDRTVKRSYRVQGNLEALGRERGPWKDEKPIFETDPPRQLYEELNHKDFFPEGELYWISPITGKKDHITTTAPWTFGDWLKAIGMTIAILGSLLFPPLSAAMVAAVLIGTGLSIAGSIHRLREQEEHGVLTQADVDRFYWDIALDLASMATLGLGKIAVAARAANALRLAGAATRAYLVMKNVNLVMDVINIGVMTHDFIAQYQAIQGSNMSDAQKKAALAKLAMFAMLSAALIIVPVAISKAKGLRKGAPLTLDVDPITGKPMAVPDAGAEAAGHVSTRATDKAHIVERTRFTHPETGEEHSFALWSDGRITRCSDIPCLQIAESVLTRLDDLRQRLPQKSQNLGGLQALAERAKALRDEAAELAAGPVKKLAAGQEAVLAKARAIEGDIAALERKVSKETGKPVRVSGAEAVKAVPGGSAGGRVTGAERASGRTQAPLDMPIVRIDPKNPPAVVPDGVVLELPTGERVWRTSGEDAGIVIESNLGGASRRKDFEAAYYSRGEMEVQGYVKSDLERAHSQGAGTGFESPFAIPYAPREVNQELQNLGIEEFLRELQRNRTPGVDYKLVTNTRMHPQTRRLSLIEYSIVAVHNNRRTTLFSTGIRVEGSLEAPLVSIAGDLTSVHPDAFGMLPLNDLAQTILQRRLDMFARRAAARAR